MPKTAVLKPKELEKILLKNGFIFVRQKGSHRTFRNPDTKKSTVVPMHRKDVAIGTLRSIIRQTNLPRELFIR